MASATTDIYTLSLHDALPIFPNVDVGARAEDAVAELLLEAGHQRQRDDQSHDADRHAERGDERDRSEEHTSELQSHSDLVCRLLLEKKKNTKNNQPTAQSAHT